MRRRRNSVHLRRKLGLGFHCMSQTWTRPICLMDIWYVFSMFFLRTNGSTCSFCYSMFIVQIILLQNLFKIVETPALWTVQIIWSNHTGSLDRSFARTTLTSTSHMKTKPSRCVTLLVAGNGMQIWRSPLTAPTSSPLAGGAWLAATSCRMAMPAHSKHRWARGEWQCQSILSTEATVHQVMQR